MSHAGPKPTAGSTGARLAIDEWNADRVAFSVRGDPGSLQRVLIISAVLLGGSTFLLGLLAFVGVRQGGIGGLICPGTLWLTVLGFSSWAVWNHLKQSAATSVVIGEDEVTVERSLPWTRQVARFSADPDMVVEWYVDEPSANDEAASPTWHIELVGGSWRVPFAFDLPEDVQRTFVRRLREHVGQSLRDECPVCGHVLWASDIRRETGQQTCRNCNWESRGRQPVLIRSRTGALMLPPAPKGSLRLEYATPEELTIKWGAGLSSWLVLLQMLVVVGLVLMCLISALVMPARNNPQQAVDIVGSLWVLGIAIGLPLVVVLYWHRHYRQHVTLTTNRARNDVEIVRSVGGIPVRIWISMERGGYVSPQLPGPEFLGPLENVVRTEDASPGDIYFVGGAGQPTAGVGRRLTRNERRWLVVALNRFFSLPSFAMPDGKPYPDACPECGRQLLPSHVSTTSGGIHCMGFPDCPWTSLLMDRTTLLEGLHEAQRQWNAATNWWKAKFRRLSTAWSRPNSGDEP